MWMNPILRNELKLNARTLRLPLVLMLYNLVLSCVAILSIASLRNQYEAGYPIQYEDIMEIFKILGWIQCILVCFMVPILTASAIAGEREKQTLDIMLTTSIRPFRIVLGKLLASMCTVCILVISSIPILSVAFLFGGMDWKDMLKFLLVIIAISIFVGSIGIFFSSLVKKTPIAIVLSFAVLGIFVFGTIFFFQIIDHIYRTLSYDVMSNDMKQLDISGTSLFMLMNPIIFFFDFMEKSAGGVGIAENLTTWFRVSSTGSLYEFAEKWWMPVSLLVQVGLAIFFLIGASLLINPLKFQRKGKRKKRKVR